MGSDPAAGFVDVTGLSRQLQQSITSPRLSQQGSVLCVLLEGLAQSGFAWVPAKPEHWLLPLLVCPDQEQKALIRPCG